MEFTEARLHDIQVTGPSLIKQGVENKEHGLDVVGGAPSNSCPSENRLTSPGREKFR
jgi:hypothetical protein